MARSKITRLSGCPLTDQTMTLGPYEVLFEPDGLAVGPRGERTHPPECARIASRYPTWFRVEPVEGHDDGGLLSALPPGTRPTPAMLFAAAAAMGPPTAEMLEDIGARPEDAALIAELEHEAWAKSLYPYGPNPRMPKLAALREPADGESEDAGAAGDATAPLPPPSEAPPKEQPPEQPAASRSFREIIDAELRRLVEQRGGADRLRGIADALELRGVGTSKAEMAEAIRAALAEHPDRERAVHDLIAGSTTLET